jgi:hypothetical protein
MQAITKATRAIITAMMSPFGAVEVEEYVVN